MANRDAGTQSRDALTRADIPELVKAVVEAMKAGHPSPGTSEGTSTDAGKPFVGYWRTNNLYCFNQATAT